MYDNAALQVPCLIPLFLFIAHSEYATYNIENNSFHDNLVLTLDSRNRLWKLQKMADNVESSTKGSLPPRKDFKRSDTPLNAPMVQSSSMTTVKKEEPEDDRIDPTIAIFEDVDGDTTDDESELVDADHVGFVEHNGVNCWVCPGLFIADVSWDQ